jgi:hypothetical protein
MEDLAIGQCPFQVPALVEGPPFFLICQLTIPEGKWRVPVIHYREITSHENEKTQRGSTHMPPHLLPSAAQKELTNSPFHAIFGQALYLPARVCGCWLTKPLIKSSEIIEGTMLERY